MRDWELYTKGGLRPRENCIGTWTSRCPKRRSDPKSHWFELKQTLVLNWFFIPSLACAGFVKLERWIYRGGGVGHIREIGSVVGNESSYDLVEAPLSDLSYSWSESIALLAPYRCSSRWREVLGGNSEMENGPEHFV